MRKLSLGLSLVLMAALLACVEPALATYPGQNGRFVRGSDAITTKNPDGSGLLQVTTPAGFSDSAPAWSPNGQRIAFQRFLTNPNQDDIYVVNADGTGLAPVTQTPTQSEDHPSFSPAGTKLVFGTCCTQLETINVDGTGRAPLTTAPPNTFYGSPKWSPDGTKIAFLGGGFGGAPSDIYTINPNGTGLANITNTATVSETTFDWSPDGSRIVFDAYSTTDPQGDVDVYVMNSDGTGRTDLTPTPAQYDGRPLWAPNGAQILFLSSRTPGGLYLINTNGTSPSWFEENQLVDDWQAAAVAAPAGPVRPKGATPLRIPLVPAYRKCNAPDLTHGAPLAYPSCSSDTLLSQYLTVGTPDANSRQANAVDSIVLRAITGDPATQANEADVKMDALITDVRGRDAPSYADYLAELRVLMTVRLTQRIELQTTSDFPFNWSVPCAGTPDPSIGSSCEASTSANAQVPGAVPEGYKSIWQLGQIHVQDGGEDGDGSTEGDNTLYLKQGIFVP